MTIEKFKAPETEFPEIFIGLVAPIGADRSPIIESIKSFFDSKNYNVYHIKISDLIKSIARDFRYDNLNEENQIERVKSYIEYGNHLRSKFGYDVFSAFAISSIIKSRGNNPNFHKNVFIIDQLKTESEIALLRQIYEKSFFQISIYSSRDVRVDYLARRFAHESGSSDTNHYRSQAEALVVQDEDEKLSGEDVAHGQKVGKIFQQADFVVNSDKNQGSNSPESQVRRFLELLFGSNSISPSHMEYGMFLAFSAALQSLDLSRQVGAAIFRKTGEIAALGTNEVPKAKGGLYWEGGEQDVREYKIGFDSNDRRKGELLREIVEILLGPKYELDDDQNRKLQQSQFMDALKYGRIVHAEMCALSDAARLGISVAGGAIYCTTFPCHMCSKHIVAAGIDQVIFLEPYPKSLTSDLHSDSVKIEGMPRGSYENYPRVDYIPFYGITPRRYRELFARKKRKDKNGAFLNFSPSGPKPIFDIYFPSYVSAESMVVSSLNAAVAPSMPSTTD